MPEEKELIAVCAECKSPEAREVSFGNDGVTHCPCCGTVEGGYDYVTEDEIDG